MSTTGITGYPLLSRRRIDEFTSQNDLEDSLLSSCAIVPFARLVYFRDCWNVDGGMTDFFPGFDDLSDDETITVSPFYFSECDIKPSRYVPFWWAIVPPNNDTTIDWIYALGYEDGLNYIDKHCTPESGTINSGGVEMDGPITRSMATKLKRGSIMRSMGKSGTSEAGDTGEWDDASESLAPAKTTEILHLTTNLHPHYNTLRQMSIHRFLGYKLFPYQWLEMMVDAILYVLVICVWKPLVITLIYLELIVKVVVYLFTSIVTEILELISPVTMVIGAFFMIPHLTFLTNVTVCMYLRKLLLSGPSDVKSVQQVYKCLICIGSVSLLQRYISGRPTVQPVHKHDVLHEVSLMYRFFKYII